MEFFKKILGFKAGVPDIADMLPEIKKNEDQEQLLEEKQVEKPKRTKEEAQDELMEKFGMRKTSDFQAALRRGEIEKVEECLAYIVENLDAFPQYKDTFNSWYSDRKAEINMYRGLKDSGDLEKMPQRSKEEAQAELITMFGYGDTRGFRNDLAGGNIENAENWLNHIINNKLSFPQYLATWDNWLADRQRELQEAKDRIGKK